MINTKKSAMSDVVICTICNDRPVSKHMLTCDICFDAAVVSWEESRKAAKRHRIGGGGFSGKGNGKVAG